jgi:hypothetical protein
LGAVSSKIFRPGRNSNIKKAVSVGYLMIVFSKEIVMAAEYTVRGKRVKIDLDGEVFVDGNYTRNKLRADGPNWKNAYGPIRELDGKSLEAALIYEGAL